MFNYYDAVREDVVDYLKDNYTKEELMEKLKDKDSFSDALQDALWAEDCVTGNGSGSYTFSRGEAKRYCLLDTATVTEALKEFCVDANTIAEKFLCEDWEYFDVTARCYVLNVSVWGAIDDIEREIKGEE